MTTPALPQDRPAEPSRRGWSRPARIVRRGVLASVLAPLATAVAILAVVLGLVVIATNWWTGYSRDVVHGRAVQPDGSVAVIDTGPPLEEAVTVLVRDDDGALRRLVVERDEADRFVNETLRRLDRERQRSVRQARAEVTALFADAFADAESALERHADWFFAWRRSYVVLEKAAVATASRLLEPGRYEPLALAVERDLAEYFMRHFEAMVLQPALREPALRQGFEDAARRAHGRWLRLVAAQDPHLQQFLAEATRHLAAPGEARRLSTLTLDWDAQRFRPPHHLTADRSFDAVLGLATIGGGAVVGAGLLAPAAERATRRILAGLARRQVTAVAARLAMAQGGAALGTVVQPAAGTAVGAVAGGLLGLAVDYTLNELDAAQHRDGFIAAHRAALDVTLADWESRLAVALEAAIDQWFADARVGLVLAD